MATNQADEGNSSPGIHSPQVCVKLIAEANDDILRPYNFRINMSISTKHPISILIVILFNLLLSLRGMFILVILSTQFRQVSAMSHQFFIIEIFCVEKNPRAGKVTAQSLRIVVALAEDWSLVASIHMDGRCEPPESLAPGPSSSGL